MSFDYKTYTKDTLPALIKSGWFDTSAVIPISSIRALSQCDNLYAAANDTLLIVCYDGEKMIGYLGLLPTIFLGKKAAWFSCIWTDENYRGKGVAKKLVADGIAAYQNQILATEFTAIAKSLYDRTNAFESYAQMEGYRCYYRLNSQQILPKKNRLFVLFLPILKIADRIYNAIFLNTKTTNNWEVSTYTEEVKQFVATFQKTESEDNIANKIQWIIDYPWLYQSEATTDSKRYHFSSAVGQFKTILAIKREKGKIIAVMLLHIRDGVLKVPYCFMNTMQDDAVSMLLDVMNRYELVYVDIFHLQLINVIKKQHSNFVYLHPIKREIIITKSLQQKIVNNNFTLQAGIGDCAFT